MNTMTTVFRMLPFALSIFNHDSPRHVQEIICSSNVEVHRSTSIINDVSDLRHFDVRLRNNSFELEMNFCLDGRVSIGNDLRRLQQIVADSMVRQGRL